MKKSIISTVALLAGVFVANGQGTVSFANYYGGGNYFTVEFSGQPVGGTSAHTGTFNDIHAGSDWSVQLYGAPGANQPVSSLVPVVLDGTANSPVLATLEGVSEDVYLGQWYSTAVGDIPGAAIGTPATVAVAAWYNNGGTIHSIEAAQANGFAAGWSATGNIASLGGAPNLPSALPVLGDGIINTFPPGLIPEPSTIALGVIGGSVFLVRLRSKL